LTVASLALGFEFLTSISGSLETKKAEVGVSLGRNGIDLVVDLGSSHLVVFVSEVLDVLFSNLFSSTDFFLSEESRISGFFLS